MSKSKNKIVEKYYAADIWGPFQTKSHFLNLTLQKLILFYAYIISDYHR